MNAAPHIKYTERDVRENEELIDLAMEYLREYEGEFQFLVDCKMRRSMEIPLTPGMIKGVLNCMRVDPRAPEMPEPLPYQAEVIPMKRKKRNTSQRRVPCDRPEFHGPHGGYGNVLEDDDGYQYCQGKYAINREDVRTEARVHTPFVMSQTGKLIHRVGDEAWFMWRVEPHDYGWRHENFDKVDLAEYGFQLYKGRWADLYVRPACVFPRLLTNPVLVPDEYMDEALESFYSGVKPREKCPRCFNG